MTWIAALLVLNLVAAGAVTAMLLRQRGALARMQLEIDNMIGEASVPAARSSDNAPAPLTERISIHLLNPMQLAAKQSRFADRFGTLTPSLIRRIVYQKAAEIVRQQLLDYGAEAEVTVHRGL